MPARVAEEGVDKKRPMTSVPPRRMRRESQTIMIRSGGSTLYRRGCSVSTAREHIKLSRTLEASGTIHSRRNSLLLRPLLEFRLCPAEALFQTDLRTVA